MNLIFDIGFNVGEFTQTCFNKYKECSVIAVEANPNLCNAVSQHFFTNYNFSLLNNLVSNKEGEEIDFYISHNATGVSTASTEFMENSRFTKGSKHLGENSINWAEPIKVQSTTIDAMIERYGMPDLIKIDVEGSEKALLEGAAEVIKRCRPRIALSVYHYPTDIFELPIIIMQLNHNYQISLGHHSFQQMETVLYCRDKND